MTVKAKINLSIVAFTVLIFSSAALVAYPFFAGIKNNSQQLKEQKQSAALLDQKTENLEKFTIVYKGLEDILMRIDNLFVPSDLPVGFITFLEKTAEENNLEIEIFSSVAPRVDSEEWPSLNFQLTALGTFPDFLKFLKKIENSPYLIEIQSLGADQGRQGQGSGSSLVEANLSIKVYAKND